MGRKRAPIAAVNMAQARLLDAGITIQKLADAAGVTRAAAQKWLDGRGIPTDGKAQLIERELHVAAQAWHWGPTHTPDPAPVAALAERMAKPAPPPRGLVEEATRLRTEGKLSVQETKAATEVQLRNYSRQVADALEGVRERDYVYSHAGYKAMRAQLLRLLSCDAHFASEARLALPEERPDGAPAQLRAVRQQLEVLLGELTQQAATQITAGALSRANATDKQVSQVRALLKRARLEVASYDKVFAGETWTQCVRELSTLLREDDDALRMAREWLEPLDDVFSKRMLGELQQVRNITWPCLRFQNDPEGFVRTILGQEPWEKQITMMNKVRDCPRFACRSGHRVGKSYALSWIMLWLYSCWPNARVFFTNSTERQVDAVNWVEVRRAIAGSGVCLACKQANKQLKPHAQVVAPCPHSAKIEGKLSDRAKGGLHSDDFREITGFTAKDAESTAGLAGENIFFLVDEASGVSQAIFIALEGNRAGGAKLALFGNPTRNEGEFYEAFYSKSKVYGDGLLTIASTESPNVQQGREVIKGLATREWCEEMAVIWGKDDPLYKVRVLGCHVLGEDGRLIPLSVIADAQERWLTIEAEGPLQIGVDVSGPSGTGDETVIAPARGNKIIELRARRGLDDDGHLSEILECIAVHGRKGEVAIVNIDSEGGIGAGVLGRLRQYEATNPGVLRVFGIKGSSNALRQPRIYDRLRDEVGANFAYWLRHGGAIPNDPKLEKELHVLELKPKLLPTKGERTKLIAKDILKKLLGRSPDRFDACALAVWPQMLDAEDVEAADDEPTALTEEGGSLDPFGGSDAFDPYG